MKAAHTQMFTNYKLHVILSVWTAVTTCFVPAYLVEMFNYIAVVCTPHSIVNATGL